MGDSGGGLFYEFGGTWYLSGIAAFVETGGMSLYNSVDPDSSYFVWIGAYRSTIEGMVAIPEPSTWVLFLLGTAATGAVLRKKKLSI